MTEDPTPSVVTKLQSVASAGDGNSEGAPVSNPSPLESAEDYQNLLDDYSHFVPPGDHEVVQGRVLKITAKDVIVDFNYKSEGIVPLAQFTAPDGRVKVAVGDVIDVMVDHGERVEGYVLLSYEKASRTRIWSDLEKAAAEQLVVSGRVVARVKGGLSVDVGVPAFMPGSQADHRPVRNLDIFLNQDIPVKIVKLNRRRGNVVVSRKAAVEEQTLSLKSQTLEHLREGAVLTGVIKNLTEYGAFVDLGGVDGLLHITDMTYGRIAHPSEIINSGDSVTVVVLKYDPAKERISLGMKQLAPDPWDGVIDRYPPQSRVYGRIVNVADYGAFVELEPGVEGLIHVSEMTWSRRMKHPSKVVKAGDEVETVVLEVHPAERRISLGLKQLEANPWSTIEQRYSIGSVVEGRVRNMTEFGAFIEIEEGIDGLVHVSDLSWTKRVKHPSEVLRKGVVVQAVILGIDAENKRLSLGIKQLQPDAWESFFHSHHVNGIVTGTICRLSGFGAFVTLADGVEGLCHFSEIPGYSGRKGEVPPVQIGQTGQFKIIRMSEEEHKVGLSMKAVAEDEVRNRLDDYRKQAAAASGGME